MGDKTSLLSGVVPVGIETESNNDQHLESFGEKLDPSDYIIRGVTIRSPEFKAPLTPPRFRSNLEQFPNCPLQAGTVSQESEVDYLRNEDSEEGADH